MKNYIIFISAICFSSFISCKEKVSPTPIQPEKESLLVLKKDSIISKPVLKFSFAVLDSGKVQLNYDTKDSIVWYADGWMVSNKKNPVFKFETNGSYFVTLRVQSNGKLFSDSTFSVKITNAKSEPEYSTLKGTLFDKKFDFKKRALPSNNYLYTAPFMPMRNFTPSVLYSLGEQTIFIANYTDQTGTSYESMKQYLTKKKQPIAKSEGNPYSDFRLVKNGWYVAIWGEKGIYKLGDNSDDLLEIVDVEETIQPKFFPEMYDKSFWVTWHIKADTGKMGKIDFNLRIKYIIYDEVFTF